MALGAGPLSPTARRGYVSAGAQTTEIDRARDEPSGSHGKASEVSRIDDRAGHPVQGRQDRRAGLPRPDRLADHLGLAWPRAGRDDRGEPDAHPRGTPPRRRHLHRRSARPGSGDRRRGVQQYRRGGRACAPRRAKRRGRRSGRHALLQQADAGRALPALQGRQRRDRNSDHHLQHSPAKRRRHVGRHDEAAVRTRQHRRRQGRDRRRRARVAPAARDGRGLYPTFWRRHDGAGRDGRRRARLHFGFARMSRPGSAPS